MQTNRSKTIAKLALPLAAGAALFAAGPALAQPVGPGGGGGNEPTNAAPHAVLNASPIHAIVSKQPVLAKIVGGGAQVDPFGGGDEVKFDATNSTDDVGVVKYYWDLDGDGQYEISGGPEVAKQSHRYFKTGTFTTHLLVKDAEGESSIDSQVITVRNAPTASIFVENPHPLVGQQVKLDADGSTADPAIANISWDLDGDGTFETDAGTTRDMATSFSTPGDHTIRVRITDGFGATAVTSEVVHVNQLPTAAFTASTSPITGKPVKFLATDSSDDGTITDYAWDLDGDGTFETNTGATPASSATYATPGTVNVRLRVTDNLGAQSVVTHGVLIALAPSGLGGGTGDQHGTTVLGDKLAPVLTFGSHKAKLAHTGKVAFKLTCPATESSCTGKLKLQTTSKKHPKSLGSTSFTLKAGQAKTVRVLLPAVQRKALRRAGHLKANAVVTAHDAAGNQGTNIIAILIGL